MSDFTIRMDVSAEHHMAVARQRAKSLAESLGMSQSSSFSIATCASELASNLVFHATAGGIITFRGWREGDVACLEMVSTDKGPGIPDVRLAMEDGFSTHGGLGGGMPGLGRMMDELEVESTVGVGTRIVARKRERCRLE